MTPEVDVAQCDFESKRLRTMHHVYLYATCDAVTQSTAWYELFLELNAVPMPIILHGDRFIASVTDALRIDTVSIKRLASFQRVSCLLRVAHFFCNAPSMILEWTEHWTQQVSALKNWWRRNLYSHLSDDVAWSLLAFIKLTACDTNDIQHQLRLRDCWAINQRPVNESPASVAATCNVIELSAWSWLNSSLIPTAAVVILIVM